MTKKNRSYIPGSSRPDFKVFNRISEESNKDAPVNKKYVHDRSLATNGIGGVLLIMALIGLLFFLNPSMIAGLMVILAVWLGIIIGSKSY